MLKALKDDCFGMASQIAYNALFSLFPGLLLIASLFGIFSNADIIEKIAKLLEYFAPPSIVQLVTKNAYDLIQSRPESWFTLGLVLTLWVASNVVTTTINALNRIYEVTESRSFWRTRLIAMGLVIGYGFTIIIAFQLIMFGRHLGRMVEELLNLDVTFSLLVDIFRWPIVFAFIVTATLIIYHIAPNIALKWRHVIPGTVFFTVLWMFITALFSLYVERFGKYNLTYGAIGTIIILMTWLYLTALILLLGGELNSEIYLNRRKDPFRKEGKEGDERRF